MNTIDILMQNSEYFTQSNFIWDLLRQIGWVVVQGFVWVCQACESLYDAMYQLIDFTQYSGFQDFVNTFKPLLYGIFAASLLAIGIMMIVGNRKHLEYLRNALLAVAVICAVPILFGKLNAVVISGKEAIESGVANNALTLVQGNIDDLIYMANNGVNEQSKFAVTGNSISAETIMNLPYKEQVESGDARLPDGWEDVFSTELSKYDMTTGAYITDEIESSFLGLFPAPYYYRYKVHYFLIYISLLALTIAYIFTAYKVVRIIWELSVGYLLSVLFAADLTNGQRLIKILNIIKNNYIVLFLLSVFLRLYTIAVQYMGTLNMNSIHKTFFLVCLSFCLIDGPNLIEKILGVDAGLSSGFQKAFAMYGAMRAGKHLLVGNSMNPNDHGLIGNTMEKIKNHFASGSSKEMGDVTNNGNNSSAQAINLSSAMQQDPKQQTTDHGADKETQNKNGAEGPLDRPESSGWHDTYGNDRSEMDISSSSTSVQDMDISSEANQESYSEQSSEGNANVENSADMENNTHMESYVNAEEKAAMERNIENGHMSGLEDTSSTENAYIENNSLPEQGTENVNMNEAVAASAIDESLSTSVPENPGTESLGAESLSGNLGNGLDEVDSGVMDSVDLGAGSEKLEAGIPLDERNVLNMEANVGGEQDLQEEPGHIRPMENEKGDVSKRKGQSGKLAQGSKKASKIKPEIDISTTHKKESDQKKGRGK